jgi:hypothetical protein
MQQREQRLKMMDVDTACAHYSKQLCKLRCCFSRNAGAPYEQINDRAHNITCLSTKADDQAVADRRGWLEGFSGLLEYCSLRIFRKPIKFQAFKLLGQR